MPQHGNSTFISPYVMTCTINRKLRQDDSMQALPPLGPDISPNSVCSDMHNRRKTIKCRVSPKLYKTRDFMQAWQLSCAELPPNVTIRQETPCRLGNFHMQSSPQTLDSMQAWQLSYAELTPVFLTPFNHAYTCLSTVQLKSSVAVP